MAATDTVFALATPGGRSGVAVIRVSGPAAVAGAGRLIDSLPEQRTAALRLIRDPDTGETIDRGVVLLFPGPRSFTGEDVVEYQVHGGVAVIADLLGVLGRLPDHRPAEPGEFTRRAFVNGRMDLSAVEGLADVIEAETSAQRRFALREMEGATRVRVEGWRRDLIQAMALLEAMIDFADEEDAPDDTRPEVRARITALRTAIAAHLDGATRGERIRDGVLVVVAGPPNAGKSTLVNALVGREVAIVSEIAGTTRDAIEARLDLGGIPVTLVDTAGLRRLSEADRIEAEGMRRAGERARAADLVLWVEAPDAAFDSSAERPEAARVLRVWSKADLGPAPDRYHVPVSSLDPNGYRVLAAAIEGMVRPLVESGDEAPVLARARHRFAFETTLDHLDAALRVLVEAPVEVAAEEVRAAARALGRVTGRVDVEDLLDVIFSSFCIGK